MEFLEKPQCLSPKWINFQMETYSIPMLKRVPSEAWVEIGEEPSEDANDGEMMLRGGLKLAKLIKYQQETGSRKVFFTWR